MSKNQSIKCVGIPTGGEKIPTGGEKTAAGGGNPTTHGGFSPDGGSPSINYAQICINNIFVDGRGRYGNGDFIACFCDALCAIAQCKELHGNTLRVLLFLMGSITKRQYIGLSFRQIMDGLDMADTSLRRSLQMLIRCQIICSTTDGHTNIYRLSDAIINPRVAIHGNTKKINKKDMPLLLNPSGGCLLESDQATLPKAAYGNFWADTETGEIQ